MSIGRKTHNTKRPQRPCPCIAFRGWHGCNIMRSGTVGHPVTVPRPQLRAVHGGDIRLSRRGTFGVIVEDCAAKD
jgi:hypothetical protein